MLSGVRWFEEQLAAVPPALQERLRADVAPLAAPETTGALADELVGIVRQRVQPLWETGACADRADALALLGTDALITYAIGFVAEHLPDDLGPYTTRLVHAVVDVTHTSPPRSA